MCRSASAEIRGLGHRYAAQDMAADIVRGRTSDGLRAEEFWALRDVSFELKPGEVVGMIGHNGAGKSTLINLVSGILRPTAGKVSLNTHKVAIMSHQGGLDAVQTGRENVINQLSLNGMSKRQIFQNFDAVVDFSEIAHSIDAPVGTYSLGMKLRLIFAIYSRLSPDLFVVDEALNGGDLRFRRKFQMFLDGYIANGGSILLASHDLYSIQSLCTKCMLLNQGQVTTIGDPVEVIDTYQKLIMGSAAASAPLVDSDDGVSLFAEMGAKAPIPDTANIVRIDSVEIKSPDGGELVPGGPAIVKIKCNVRESLGAVSCTLAINADSNLRLAMITTIQPELRQGDHELECTIDSLPLLTARYQMLVAFASPDNGTIFGIKGWFDQPVPFEIGGSADRVTTVNRFFRSFMHVQASWSVEPAGES